MRDLEVEIVPELVREIDPRRDLSGLIALTGRIRVLYDEHRRLGFPERSFVVHTHSSKAGILGRFAARAARVPVIVHTIHGFGFFEGQAEAVKRAFIAAERAAARVTDGFISVSRASLAEAHARKIVGPRQTARVIRSGFDLEPFFAAASAERRAAARAVLGLATSDEVIVAIANMKPQKDPLALVAAFAEVARERPRALCLFAGDGELRPAVSQAISSHGLEQRFRLLGWRTDIPELLAAADVVALSSIFEGLPRSAVQAVAARRPFVGTRVDGTPEIIRDGRNGFLVPPRDPAALARALVRALVERPLDPLDEERVRAWDVRAMVREEERFYESLIAEPIAGSAAVKSDC
jgi:glycosyltransferase involved in cell wall biosynthesis